MQFLAALNQTYIVTHSLAEKGETYKNKLFKAIEELKKSEELRKKQGEEAKEASVVKVSLECELAKLKVDNVELQTQLHRSQEDCQAI